MAQQWLCQEGDMQDTHVAIPKHALPAKGMDDATALTMEMAKDPAPYLPAPPTAWNIC